MRAILLTAAMAATASIGLSQNSRVPTPTANSTSQRIESTGVTPNAPATAMLTKTVLPSKVKYTFQSNKPIYQSKAPQWEQRYLSVYPIIEEIHIDPSTEIIELILPDNHTSEELLPIIQKFNYSDYQIMN